MLDLKWGLCIPQHFSVCHNNSDITSSSEILMILDNFFLFDKTFLNLVFPPQLSGLRTQHSVCEDASLTLASLSGLGIWHCCQLWCRSQMLL